jgi:hypothetical protein
MAMFEMTPDQAAEWCQKLRDTVAGQVNGEEVLGAGAFRRGGATASMVASKAQLGFRGMTALTIESPADGFGLKP